jgi:hypothetical protein
LSVWVRSSGTENVLETDRAATAGRGPSPEPGAGMVLKGSRAPAPIRKVGERFKDLVTPV